MSTTIHEDMISISFKSYNTLINISSSSTNLNFGHYPLDHGSSVFAIKAAQLLALSSFNQIKAISPYSMKATPSPPITSKI